MENFWILLVEFVLRLVGGIGAALLLVPPKEAEGRFFRNKLIIGLGLLTVAILAHSVHVRGLSGSSPSSLSRWELIAAAGVAYMGCVVWMLGRVAAGRFLTAVLAALALHMATVAVPDSGHGSLVGFFEPISSGLLLGAVVIAMMLGHWYLNAPGMSLGPIRRLVLACGVLLVVRVVVVAAALVWDAATDPVFPPAFGILRWSAGLLLPLILCGMVWWTLKVPNTQSATGILYAMVVLIFIGELVALLLVR